MLPHRQVLWFYGYKIEKCRNKDFAIPIIQKAFVILPNNTIRSLTLFMDSQKSHKTLHPGLYSQKRASC